MNSKWHQLLASQAGKTWSLLRCRGSIVGDRLGPPFLCSVLAWITVLLLFTSPRVSANQPNIIIFLADDLGYADVGFNGCREILTTHIDTIAVNGVKFTDGYANHPACSPSRARLLSGRTSTAWRSRTILDQSTLLSFSSSPSMPSIRRLKLPRITKAVSHISRTRSARLMPVCSRPLAVMETVLLHAGKPTR